MGKERNKSFEAFEKNAVVTPLLYLATHTLLDINRHRNETRHLRRLTIQTCHRWRIEFPYQQKTPIRINSM